MNEILISPQVSLELFLSSLVLLFLTFALYHTFYILLRYNKNATSTLQYELEKRSLLSTTIIKVALSISIFLFILFVLSIDTLAELIPGAMCGAGVVSSGAYGSVLIALKFIVIILAMFWIQVDNEDQKAKGFPYFSLKMYLYIFLYFLITLSWFFELSFFMSLSVEEPVLCCSNLYTSQTTTFIFGMSIQEIVVAFYITYLFMLLAIYLGKKVFLSLLSILFLYLSYIAIVYFFSEYIYELPTHKCPYCILAKEYYFIGYFIYGAFIMANYYVLYGIVFSFKEHTKIKIIGAYTLFIFLVSFKYVYYFLNNNLFL